MRFRVPERWVQARDLLRPALRSPARPPGSLRAERAGSPLLRFRFAPLLDELVTVDLPDVRLYLRPSHLERWGVEPEVARLRARDNLDPEAGLERGPGGLWRLAAGDGRDSARLVLPGWLQAFAERVPGRPVAVVPHARLLLVGGSSDPDQVALLLRLARDGYQHGGDPVSPAPYTTGDDGQVEPWQPPPGEPHHAAARAGHLLLAGQSYVDQARELSEEELPAPFGTFGMATTPERCLSFTRWPRGARLLLPRADLVVLEGDGAPLAVPREVLAARFPAALVPVPGLRPPRDLAGPWPDPRILADAALDLPGLARSRA